MDDEERKKQESLTPEEEALMERAFNTLNTDGSGLTVDQLREALQAMGINMSLNDIMTKLQLMGYEVGPGLRLGLPDFKRFLLELSDEEQQGGHSELVEISGEEPRYDFQGGRR